MATARDGNHVTVLSDSRLPDRTNGGYGFRVITTRLEGSNSSIEELAEQEPGLALITRAGWFIPGRGCPGHVATSLIGNTREVMRGNGEFAVVWRGQEHGPERLQKTRRAGRCWCAALLSPKW